VFEKLLIFDNSLSEGEEEEYPPLDNMEENCVGIEEELDN